MTEPTSPLDAGDLNREYRPKNSYLIFSDTHIGFVLAEANPDGTSDRLSFENGVIPSIMEGRGNDRALQLICVPNKRDKHGYLSRKDATTLGELFSKPKNRGNNAGLRNISPKDRWGGKINWEKERPAISKQIRDGSSISEIARRLGISTSALSKANNLYKLYPKQRPFGK
jgi:hypothetical protein